MNGIIMSRKEMIMKKSAVRRIETVKELFSPCLPLTREVAKTKFLTEGEKKSKIIEQNK